MNAEISTAQVREALDLGWVAEVVVYCDPCGLQVRGDYVAPTAEGRLYAARVRLSQVCGWVIKPGLDLCAVCAGEVRFCPEYPHGEACEVDDDGWVPTVAGDRVHPDDLADYEELLALSLKRDPRPAPFMDQYRAGVTGLDVDDFVEAWHVLPEGPEGVVPTLAAYLGMEPGEYAAWVTTGKLPDLSAPTASA